MSSREKQALGKRTARRRLRSSLTRDVTELRPADAPPEAAPNRTRAGERHGGERRMLVILGALVAFGPLSMDAYLPALPALSDDLHTSATPIQLTLTACLLGLATGQMVAGPLSDRLGRRPPLLVGLVAFAATSLLCALAPSVWALIVLRFLQGVGGGAGIVIGRAVVRDRYRSAHDAARFFALMMMVTGVAPILAPIVGAGVLHVGSWRWIFVLLGVIGGAIFTATLTGLPESLPRHRRRREGAGATAAVFRRLLLDRGFTAYALASGLTFGAMFAYIAGSPFVLQEVYGLSPSAFSIVFGINALGIVTAGMLSSRMVSRVGPRRLLALGLVECCGGAAVLLLAVTFRLGVVAVCVALFAVVSSVGLVMPNATALALADHPDTAGSASALLGLLQFAIGAVAAPLVGVAGATNAYPMAIVIAVLAAAAVAQSALLPRSRHASA